MFTVECTLTEQYPTHPRILQANHTAPVRIHQPGMDGGSIPLEPAVTVGFSVKGYVANRQKTINSRRNVVDFHDELRFLGFG